MTILYRCEMCDPKLYRIDILIPTDTRFHRGLAEIEEQIRLDHKIKHPECPASMDGPRVSIDFLLRMVQ